MERSPCMLCPSVTMQVSSIDHVWTVERSRDPFVTTALRRRGCPESSGPKDKGHLSVCAVMHSMVVAIIVVMFKWPRHSHGGIRHQQSVNRRQSDSALRPHTGLGTECLEIIGLTWPLHTIESAGGVMWTRAGSNVADAAAADEHRW